MAPPAISVLIAARDAAATLPRTLRSVQRQTVQDWECLVVDDGSTDSTAEALRFAARADARIRVLNTPAAGVVAARNLGLSHCRAPLVAVMDADDSMHPRRLELQAAALSAHAAWDAVGCHVRYFPRAEFGEGMHAYEAWLNSMRDANALHRDRFIEMPVGHPTLMARRVALDEVGGWRDRGWPEDWDLLLRLMQRGNDVAPTVGVVPRRLLAWQIRPRSLSRNSEAYTIEGFTRCRAAFLAQDYLAGEDEYTLMGYGSTGKELRRALEEHGKHMTQLIELHPGRVGQQIHGAPVEAPEALRAAKPRRLIASVSGAAAREQLRSLLRGMGYVELRDFVCAA